jgi:hypothetical protein
MAKTAMQIGRSLAYLIGVRDKSFMTVRLNLNRRKQSA